MVSKQQKPAPKFAATGRASRIPWKKETSPMVTQPNPIITALLRKHGDTLAPSAALPICRDLVAKLIKRPRDRQLWEALAYTALKVSEGVS